MAQTKKKRNRKRRGTQGGGIDTRKRARPRTRNEARNQARAKRTGGPRTDNPPTWKGAAIRGVVAALVFVVMLLLILNREPNEAIIFGVFMLALYIPAGYYMDTVLWRRRERARIRAGK